MTKQNDRNWRPEIRLLVRVLFTLIGVAVVNGIALKLKNNNAIGVELEAGLMIGAVVLGLIMVGRLFTRYFRGVFSLLLIGTVTSIPFMQARAEAQFGPGLTPVKTIEVAIPVLDGVADMSGLPAEIPQHIREQIAKKALTMKPGTVEVIVDGDASVVQSEVSQIKAKSPAVLASIGVATAGAGAEPNAVVAPLGLLAMILLVIAIFIVVGIIIYQIIQLLRHLGWIGGGHNGGNNGGENDGNNRPAITKTASKLVLSYPAVTLTDTNGVLDAQAVVLQVSTNLTDWVDACTTTFTNMALAVNGAVTNVVGAMIVSTNGIAMTPIPVTGNLTGATNSTIKVEQPIELNPFGYKPARAFFRLAYVGHEY